MPMTSRYQREIEAMTMKVRKITYDTSCEDLARHFLSDERNVTEKMVACLASHIQQQIEDWIQYDEDGPRHTLPVGHTGSEASRDE